MKIPIPCSRYHRAGCAHKTEGFAETGPGDFKMSGSGAKERADVAMDA